MIEKWFKQCLLLQITTAMLITSLGPGFALWENGEKIGQARRAERVWGERLAPPFLPPQGTARLASFPDIFPS